MSNILWKDKVSNEEVLRRLGTERKLLDKIKKRKCRYYGHIKRKNNVLTMAVEGRVQVDPETHGLKISMYGPNRRPMNAPRKQRIATCGVSLHVKGRRGDDNPR